MTTAPAPSRRRTSAAAAAHFGHGLLMGGADIIPGVSGGTVALIVGIYERLVDSVRAFATAIVSLVRADRAGARAQFRAVEWRLVLPLGAGIVTAIGLGSLVIPHLLEQYPSQMLGVFFGLIAGSLIVPWRRIRGRDPARVAIALVAAVIAAVLVGLPPREIPDPALLVVFLSASVAICAMILPGVSGAFLLLVLGVYDATLAAISGLDLGYVAVFVLGAAIGLGAFSRLLSHLLHHHHDTTMAALVGLMGGSLRALWPWQTHERGLLAPPADAGAVLVVAGLAIAGFAAVTLLVRLGAADATAPEPSASR